MTELDAPVLIGKATYHLHPDDTHAFKAVMERVAADGSSSPGCLFFHVAQDVGNPTIIYLLEGWDSGESVAAYNGDPAFQANLSQALALRITSRGGHIYSVSGVQAMPMPS